MYYLFDQTFPFLAHVPSCPRALPTAAVPAKSVKYKVFFSTAAACGGVRVGVPACVRQVRRTNKRPTGAAC